MNIKIISSISFFVWTTSSHGHHYFELESGQWVLVHKACLHQILGWPLKLEVLIFLIET